MHGRAWPIPADLWRKPPTVHRYHPVGDARDACAVEEAMSQQHSMMIAATVAAALAIPVSGVCQSSAAVEPHGPYARIAMMRAVDESHLADLEAGYVRHLEWHRQANDPFNWYSYSVWASSERQRWIVYATFGHTAAELAHPVAPAEDERDTAVTLLRHVQFMGSAVYEFLPAASRGTGVPTPLPVAEYTSVDVAYGSGAAFEAALSAAQPTLDGETLWYRLVVGGNASRYIRLRPRASLEQLLDQHASQALPQEPRGGILSVTSETLNLRPTMLVNVVPAPR
jgi:hypothetical protein